MLFLVILSYYCPPIAETQTEALVGNMEVADVDDTVGGEDQRLPDHHLGELQRRDPDLQQIIHDLERGELPLCENEARKLVLGKSQYTFLDGVLYHIQPDHTLRVIPPTGERERLFREAHAGPFSGHLCEAKIQLGRHYWWPGMRRDITTWCRKCQPCATRSVGRCVKPTLPPIPVAGPFGVDILQLPRTKRGNRYAVVFVEYLTKWPEVYAVPDQTAPTIARLLVEEIVSRHGFQGNCYRIVDHRSSQS